MSVMLIDETKSGNLIEGIRQFTQMWNCCNFMIHTDTGRLYQEPLQKFVRQLYQANLNTWNRKYNEVDTIPDILQATGEPLNKYQTLKTLQALRYNIEEEYMPTVKKLLEQLQVMIDEIMYILVTEQEEYKNAEWG